MSPAQKAAIKETISSLKSDYKTDTLDELVSLGNNGLVFFRAWVGGKFKTRRVYRVCVCGKITEIR